MAEKKNVKTTKSTKAKTAPKKATKQEKPKVSVKKLEVLCTIVPRAKGDFYADIIQDYEVNMQMILNARGTASIDILGMLGLADADKAVIFSVIREDKIKECLGSLEDKFNTIKGGRGIAFTFPMSSIIGVAIYGFLSNNEKVVKGGANNEEL